MGEHVAEEDDCGRRLTETEVGSDETVVEKCIDPFRCDEEVTVGS